ncbi:hypothetical protein BH09BAC3_BH09BAC3_04990 [soil metagenome]
MNRRVIVLGVILFGVVFSLKAQKLVQGVIVDSLSLDNMSGVYIKVKNTNKITASNAHGIFSIMLLPTDTLIFSFVGYLTKSLPVQFEDEIMFVRMKDESIMLAEVLIRDRSYLNKEYIYSPTLSTTKPLPAAGVNFAYFSKAEKEKRKLVEVLKEFDLVKVYVAVVNDRSIREEIMEKYSMTEVRYYELLAIFNQKNNALMHSSNADLIIEKLFSYFEDATEEK